MVIFLNSVHDNMNTLQKRNAVLIFVLNSWYIYQQELIEYHKNINGRGDLTVLILETKQATI